MAIDYKTKVICHSQTKQDESHMFANPSWETNSRWPLTFLSLSRKSPCGLRQGQKISEVCGTVVLKGNLWPKHTNCYRNSHKDLIDLKIRKLVVQILMDMQLWDALTRLLQTGNWCWFFSCGGRTSFISLVSALHQQHRNASVLSAYSTQTTSSSDYIRLERLFT